MCGRQLSGMSAKTLSKSIDYRDSETQVIWTSTLSSEPNQPDAQPTPSALETAAPTSAAR